MVDYFPKLTWMNDSKLEFDKWDKIIQNEILKCSFLKLINKMVTLMPNLSHVL